MSKTFISLEELEQVKGRIKKFPNQKREVLRAVHYGCFLLCSEVGLRISEAVRFDLRNKTQKGLYKIEKPKGKRERLVYVPKKVVKELEANHWQPNQTNRWNFYHFLKKVKQELGISPKTELTPHTLRRAFTTYHAESGTPLPLLQKLLGHSSIRTTALYWRDIHGDDDTDDILTGKKWLEKPKPPKTPITENFPKSPDKDMEPITENEPVINTKKPTQPNNLLLITENEKNPIITNYQPKALKGLYQKSLQNLRKLCISEISPKNQGKFSLNNNKPLPTITYREQPATQEQILLERIKQLEEQLAKVQRGNG